MTEQELKDLIKSTISEVYKELDEESNASTEVKEAIILGEDEINEKIKVLNINEGQFSWMTQDTDRQIGSERENTITVYMHDAEGNSWKENSYEGYGVFGKMDYYSLVAKMNGYADEDRGDGIDLTFNKKKSKTGKKVLFPALTEKPKLPRNHDFTKSPENDPNQSWFQDEDYDDYNS
jgi:hypothetical protein|tara:strand:+ start:199 stop:732 length:534 start_codon:yes stop_codon:yes gene_type:complete